jgi:hypothetical protein
MNVDGVSRYSPLSSVGPVAKAEAKASDSSTDVMLSNESIVRENQSRETKNKVLKFIGYGVGAVGAGIGVGLVGLSVAAFASGIVVTVIGAGAIPAYGAGVPVMIIGPTLMFVVSLALFSAGVGLTLISIALINEVYKHYTAPKVPERDDINEGPVELPVPPPRGDEVSKALETEVKEPVADKDFTTTESLIKMQRAKLKHVEQEKRAWDKTGIFENKDRIDRVQNNTPESSPSEVEDDEWG